MSTLFNFLIPISLAAVLVTLGFGLYALFRGGDYGRSWSNKLMRLRVAFQALALILVMAVLWFAR